jgi:hypothetical protein
MKKFFCLLTLLALAGITVVPGQLFAQAADTLAITPSPAGNINNVINGDTLAGGVRAHPNRVYQLSRGLVYQVTQPMKVDGPITMIANAGTSRPPVLAPAILADNSSIDHFFDFIGKGSKVSISNMYLISFRADGAQLGWSDGMRVSADSIKLKLRGVIFDGFTDAGVVLNNNWIRQDVQDCVFRNLMHSSSWFGGQPLMSGNLLHQDTCKIINNTFFCNNSYSWSVRGYCPYALFEHNTMVYGTVNPFLIRQAPRVHIKNNLFYAMHAMGGNPDHVINSWFLNYPDTASDGIVHVRAYDTVSYWYHLWGSVAINGPNSYADAANGVTAAMVGPDKRVLDIENNAYFWPQKYFNFVKAYNDTVQSKDSVDVPVYGNASETKMYLKRILYRPSWITAYTLWSADSLMKPAGATVNISSNLNLDPGFSATNVLNQMDTLDAYVAKIATGTLDRPWFYSPSNVLYPPVWPLPENLAYTSTTLQSAGTDGFAVGDLNWFPTQKQQWINTAVGKNPSGSLPKEYALGQNYPNPFNPTTTIQYQIPASGLTTLKVYNLLGQEVATLVDGLVPVGSHQVTFDATRLTSGVYFYTLHSGNYVSTKKLMLLK